MQSRSFVARVVAILVIALSATILVPLPVLAAPIVSVDEGGANDVPGQKDLTQHSVDTAQIESGVIVVGWQWDDTRWSGNNTGDACALFDTDGDGRVNYALCVTVEDGPPATQTADSPRLYTCGDAKVDRCTNPIVEIPQAEFDSNCDVSVGDDPFNNSDDTAATCEVHLDDVGAQSSQLVNSCSYPSEQPNSDPSDCVLIPRDAFITIVKVANPAEDGTDFSFTITPPGGTAATIDGSGSSGPIPVRSDVPVTVAEVVPSGWTLNTISCNGGSPSVSNPSVTVDLTPDQQITCTFTNTKQNPSLNINKEGSLALGQDNAANPGDVITYTFFVENTGNVDLTGVTVTDPLSGLSAINCPSTTLAVGASMTCSATYAITQADINAGEVNNTATADSDQSAPDSDSNTETIPQTATLELDKEGTLATGTDGANPGDVISYTFEVTNTGNVTLTGITVTDPLSGLSSISCPGTTLAPGTSMTCSATYAITQSDIDAGQVQNTATADSTESGPDSDTNVELITQAASISIDKEGTLAEGGDGADPGDVISYTFEVTNIGNVTLTGISVTDPLPGLSAIDCPATTLTPGASMTCTATYAITQADIDAGSVTNTATADSDQSGPDEDTNVETITQSASLVLDKEGTLALGGNGIANPGDVISYTFAVTNTGNVTLTGISVTDPLTGLSSISCPSTTLAPGADMICTATYAITQADVDAGEVENTATADSTQSGPDSDTNVEPIPQAPSITIDKEGSLADGGDGADPGDVITYSFLVTNTGNVTLTNVTVTDPLPGLSAIDCGGVTTLAPGAFMTCTATYAITQADIDAGRVDNTATADSDESAPDDDSNTETIAQTPALDTEKSGVYDDANGDGIANPGDEIDYTITVTNTGNQTLTGVTVSDPLAGTLDCTWPGATGTLAPGQTVTCTGTYVITQADIDEGNVHNVATGDSDQTPPEDDEFDVPIQQTPAIHLEKEGALDLGDDNAANPGDDISYTFTVTNTGNVTLTGITVTDPLTGLSAIDCPATTLAPGASMICTATYDITQPDIDAGSVTNTGTADSTESEPDDDTNVEPIPQVPSITIDKEGAVDEGADGANPGDEIEYTFLVTNTGNVTLTNVTVTDPLTGLSAISCPATTLAPGAFMVCTAAYEITQADIDAGSVTNTATADSNQSEPDTDTNVEPITQAPALDTEKTGVLVDVDENGRANPGDRIDYTITVSNLGNQTLTGVTVSDPKLGTLDCTWPTATTGTLPVGTSVSCTGSYTITQADVDAGSVLNTATGDSDQTPPNDEEETVPIPQVPAIDIDKEGTIDEGDDGADPGDVISYTFVVTNTGNVTLTGITVTDPLTGLSAIDCPSTTLAPGGSMTCTATYAITQSDIDVGSVTNTATADSDESDPDSDTEVVPITQAPAIDTEKSGVFVDVDDDGVAEPGDRIDYTITVSNIGNQTLTGVTVVDPLAGDLDCTWPGTAGTLAPGETVTCTGSYTITQADVDAGNVHNVATGDSDQTPPEDDEFDVPIEQEPALDTEKSGVFVDVDDDGVAEPGDRIDYTITVSNIGNQTLTGVTVVDPLAGDLDCVWPGTAGTLAPGETVTCTGSYTITQADIDAGNVHNVATGDSDQTPPEDDEFDVPIEQEPAMSVAKTSVNLDENGDGLLNEGDTLTYTITVTNTGNQTLTGVTVSDEVPAQTTFVSCSDECDTDGPPVTEATWTIDQPIAPGASVPVSMTVEINSALTSCQICNTAFGDSDFTASTPSNELCLAVTPGAHPEGANASGDAYAAKVDVDLLGIDTTLVPVDSSQSGVGADADGDDLLSVSIPATGSVLRAGLLTTTSSSEVSEQPARASDTSTAEVLGVNILNGVVTADVVRAVASATADGTASTASSLGSTFKNLKVRGVAMNNVAPNTTVKLPAALFGSGSYVRLYEKLGGTSRPAPGQSTGGTYAADMTVNMIRVHITNMALLGGVEVVVSHATAHADFPQITLCGTAPLRAVSGHAFVAHAAINPELLEATVGFVGIPASGGAEHQALPEADLLEPDGDVVHTEAASSDSWGAIGAAGALSSSYAQAADVCVLRMADGCTVGATLVRSQANSQAGGGSAISNAGGTQLVGLTVAGTPINVTPAPNTVIELPGLGFVILNEQFCDGTASMPGCAGTTSSGMTVRSIRVVITLPALLIEGLGVEVIVAEAHADTLAEVAAPAP